MSLGLGDQSTKVFVGQIPHSYTDEEMRGIFSPYGEIKEVMILKDRQTGMPKGCGFVTYTTREEAQRAIDSVADKVKLPGTKRELIVKFAGKDKPEEKKS